MAHRKKPFVVLELTEAEARAVLHCIDLAMVVSGKGEKKQEVRIGQKHWPNTAGEASRVGRVRRRLSPLFRHGSWFSRLSSEPVEGEVPTLSQELSACVEKTFETLDGGGAS